MDSTWRSTGSWLRGGIDACGHTPRRLVGATQAGLHPQPDQSVQPVPHLRRSREPGMAIHLRVQRSTVQTAVRHYAHPETGRQVTVVGTMHFGSAWYFEELLTVITEREAAG